MCGPGLGSQKWPQFNLIITLCRATYPSRLFSNLSPRRNRQTMTVSTLCVAWPRASLGEGAYFDAARGDIEAYFLEGLTGSMQKSLCTWKFSNRGVRASTPLSLAGSNALSPIGCPQIFSRHAVARIRMRRSKNHDIKLNRPSFESTLRSLTAVQTTYILNQRNCVRPPPSILPYRPHLRAQESHLNRRKP